MTMPGMHRNVRWRARGGRSVDPYNTRGMGSCDGCGFVVHYDELREQVDYRGGSVPVPIGYKYCRTCYSRPQPYYQLQVLRPDPVPLRQPRNIIIPAFNIITEDGDAIITEDGDNITIGQ